MYKRYATPLAIALSLHASPHNHYNGRQPFHDVYMNRRRFLMGCGAAATTVGLAGCSGTTLNASGEESDSGGIIAEDVQDAPTDATVVDATSGRLSSIEQVQSVLQQAATDSRGYAMASLTGEDFESVLSALDPLPKYSGSEGVPGYYLKYDTNVVLLYPFYRE